MKRLLLAISLLICLGTAGSQAQELNCTVTVNSDQIQGTNKSIFNTLQQAISEYVNQNRWTSLNFAENERIECSMTLIVSSVNDDNYFTAEMLVQSRRPVFNTSYSTPLINMRDKNFNFQYSEYDRLDYQEGVFTNNLTAMLGYYCYLIIGFDLDTYSRLGGTPCFQQCESIAMSAQTQTMQEGELIGWGIAAKAGSGRNKNRYALSNNLMDEAFKPLRNYFYEYHRLGLDMMTANVANARAKIAEGLPVVREANKARPNTYLVPVWMDAKADELTNIFSKATDSEKKSAYDILTAIDPTRQNLYESITRE